MEMISDCCHSLCMQDVYKSSRVEGVQVKTLSFLSERPVTSRPHINAMNTSPIITNSSRCYRPIRRPWHWNSAACTWSATINFHWVRDLCREQPNAQNMWKQTNKKNQLVIFQWLRVGWGWFTLSESIVCRHWRTTEAAAALLMCCFFQSKALTKHLP